MKSAETSPEALEQIPEQELLTQVEQDIIERCVTATQAIQAAQSKAEAKGVEVTAADYLNEYSADEFRQLLDIINQYKTENTELAFFSLMDRAIIGEASSHPLRSNLLQFIIELGYVNSAYSLKRSPEYHLADFFTQIFIETIVTQQDLITVVDLLISLKVMAQHLDLQEEAELFLDSSNPAGPRFIATAKVAEKLLQAKFPDYFVYKNWRASKIDAIHLSPEELQIVRRFVESLKDMVQFCDSVVNINVHITAKAGFTEWRALDWLTIEEERVNEAITALLELEQQISETSEDLQV